MRERERERERERLLSTGRKPRRHIYLRSLFDPLPPPRPTALPPCTFLSSLPLWIPSLYRYLCALTLLQRHEYHRHHHTAVKIRALLHILESVLREDASLKPAGPLDKITFSTRLSTKKHLHFSFILTIQRLLLHIHSLSTANKSFPVSKTRSPY